MKKIEQGYGVGSNIRLMLNRLKVMGYLLLFITLSGPTSNELPWRFPLCTLNKEFSQFF
jgi:hypothetical protein